MGDTLDKASGNVTWHINFTTIILVGGMVVTATVGWSRVTADIDQQRARITQQQTEIVELRTRVEALAREASRFSELERRQTADDTRWVDFDRRLGEVRDAFLVFKFMNDATRPRVERNQSVPQ